MAMMQKSTTMSTARAASRRVAVVPMAAKTATIKKPQVAAKPAKESGTSLAVLAKIEQLQLLSKVEELGLLSKLEEAGFTLSKIEQLGLLSTAEKSGLLSLLADKKTPGTINALGLVLLAAAAGVVYAVPDDSTALLAAQAVGAAVLAGAGGAAFVGSSLLASFQK